MNGSLIFALIFDFFFFMISFFYRQNSNFLILFLIFTPPKVLVLLIRLMYSPSCTKKRSRAPESGSQYVLISGPFTSLCFTGPFASHNDAVEWGSSAQHKFAQAVKLVPLGDRDEREDEGNDKEEGAQTWIVLTGNPTQFICSGPFTEHEEVADEIVRAELGLHVHYELIALSAP
jgi:hypothetical protein